ncbi:MAG: hypothetical protein J1F03_09370 [Oscillospiraceae bacterium]|nr:hypothetical protein [Oscillospiraceae bacterium]
MKIQTQVNRDTRPDSIERDSFSSKVDERGVGNIRGLKTSNSSHRVKTTAPPKMGGRGNKRKRKKQQAKKAAAEREAAQIESEKARSDKPESALQTSVEASVNTAAESASSTAASGTGSAKLPPRLKNGKDDKQKNKREKYNSAKMDSDGSAAIEMVQGVQAAGGVAVQAGGILRTAVKGGANGLGSIKTFVQRGVNIGSAKDVGRIATAVNTTVANAAKDTGQQMLRTKIDKSNTTDTGAETIKQGLTELRYADNARKALLNTSRAVVNTGKSVKNFAPKSKHISQTANRRNSKKAAKKAAAEMRKLITSKVGLIILGAAAAILILILLVNAVVTLICSAISSLFSWLFPSSGNSKTETEMLYDYRTAVVEYIKDKQQDINNIVDGFVCDHKSYSPYAEISELNQFGYKKIDTEDYNEILAILAVKKYRDMASDTDNMDALELNFTAAEIAETVERFYIFEYYYTYGNCSGQDCKKRERTVVHNRGTRNEWTEVITTYYCDVNHQWLNGKVTNIPLDDVLSSYGFTDREWELYQMYLEQINIMMGGG